jgi:small subunit ribosomal protein S16
LEILGNYNPQVKPKVLNIKKERVLYWLSKGAQTSDTVHNILVKEGVIDKPKRRVVTISAERSKKLAQVSGA